MLSPDGPIIIPTAKNNGGMGLLLALQAKKWKFNIDLTRATIVTSICREYEALSPNIPLNNFITLPSIAKEYTRT